LALPIAELEVAVLIPVPRRAPTVLEDPVAAGVVIVPSKHYTMIGASIIGASVYVLGVKITTIGVSESKAD
jgi:hypothetical protein